MKRNLWLRKCTVGVLRAVIGTAVLLSPACVRASPPGTGWVQVFSDDFNGTALDPNKWNTCYHWSCTIAANNELQWYQPDDVIVQNGTLRLRGQKRSMNGYSYTSGMISSHDKYAFQYGYAEIRAKLPKGKGLWPAFWLLPRNGWPPELDVMENLGHDPNRAYMTLHYKTSNGPANSGSNYWANPDFSANYHTFAMQWSPERIIWYVDGVERKRYEVTANLPTTPLYIIANLAVGGNWPGFPDATTPFPSYYDIDYIKVWRNNSSPSTLTSTPIITETEGLTVAAKSGDTHRTITDAQFSGSVGSIIDANAANDYVTYTVNVPEARTYNVRVRVKKIDIRGKFQLAVNGTNYGISQDLYSVSSNFVELDVANITFGSVGNMPFKFTIVGKNASSKGYTLGFDYIKLIPK